MKNNVPHKLIGTWQFDHSILTDENQVIMPNDPVNNAIGLLVYTDTHYMSAQLHIPNTEPGNEASSIQLSTNYIAYYAKINIDDSKQIVTQNIISSNIPDMIHKKVIRKFTFHNDNQLSLVNLIPEQVATKETIYRELFWNRITEIS
jgi:hypothetical protein